MQTMAQDTSCSPLGSISRSPSTGQRWAGRVLSSTAVLFLLFDSTGKLLQVQPVMDGAIRLGYPPDIVFGLGVTLLTCIAAYLIPRTSVFGALLLTGYLGGAAATQVRVNDAWFMFPVALGVLAWLGLYLRDARLRSLLPLAGRA